jgi:hypothetical protein
MRHRPPDAPDDGKPVADDATPDPRPTLPTGQIWGHSGTATMMPVAESVEAHRARRAEQLARGDASMVAAHDRGRTRPKRPPEPEVYGPPDPRRDRLPMRP